MSVSVEYNSREINQIIIENIFRMLERRKIISSWESEIKNISDIQNKYEFELPEYKISIYRCAIFRNN